MSDDQRPVWIRLPSGSVRGPYERAQVVSAWKSGRIPVGSGLALSQAGPWKPVEQCFRPAPSPPQPPAPQGTAGESTATRKAGAGLWITYSVLLLVLAFGAAVPVYKLYGKFEDRRREEARVASSRPDERTQPAVPPAPSSSPASESAAEHVASLPEGTRLTLDEFVRLAEEGSEIYRDFIEARDAWRETSNDDTCSKSMKKHRSRERILEGFRRFLGEAEEADSGDEQSSDFAELARMVGVDPGIIYGDLSDRRATDEFDWAMRRFGRDDTLSRLSASTEAARIEAEEACGAREAPTSLATGAATGSAVETGSAPEAVGMGTAGAVTACAWVAGRGSPKHCSTGFQGPASLVPRPLPAGILPAFQAPTT